MIEDIKKNMLCKPTGLIHTDSYRTGLIHVELADTKAAYTGLSQVCIRWGSRAERSGHMFLP